MPFDSQPTTTTHRLAACHEAQIDALTMPGLSDEERVTRFAEAAGFTDLNMENVKFSLACLRGVAYSVWIIGKAEKSLFADLPGCQCPVLECLPGVPHVLFTDWHPTRSDLEVFARIQQERRA